MAYAGSAGARISDCLTPMAVPETARGPQWRLDSMKLITVSDSRYNGGVKAKRLYGSSTITTFWVYPEGHDELAIKVEVGGRTPGDRATAAKAKAEPILRKMLEVKGVSV